MTTERRDSKNLEFASDCSKAIVDYSKTIVSIASDLDKALEQQKNIIDTKFSTWVRTNVELDSIQRGLSIHNIDWIIHQYKVVEDKNGPRNVNNLMLIEEKTRNAEARFPQRDTLSILDQCLLGMSHNRKIVNEKGQYTIIRYYRLHYLQFSHDGPLDSNMIRWDGREIDLNTLEQIIRFEINPITLRKRDTTERRHHNNKNKHLMSLFKI